MPQLTAGEKPLIRVVHDKCTFYANSDQSFFWGDDYTNVLRQKSLGASIMMSDFIDEVSGFVRDEEGEARLLLETHQEGYFTNDLLIQQVEKTINIFERVHPNATGIFLFDNAPSHRKVVDDALNADRMNVGPGGKQPIMRDTVWGGQVQRLVDDDGIPKGMKNVLQERGVDISGMKCKDMRDLLKTFPDFKQQTTILEDYVNRREYICIFYPKFHCELSPIEHVWCQAKKTHQGICGWNNHLTTENCTRTEGLNSVTLEQIKKFCRTCRDYERVYREGGAGREVEERVKYYKSQDKYTARKINLSIYIYFNAYNINFNSSGLQFEFTSFLLILHFSVTFYFQIAWLFSKPPKTQKILLWMTTGLIKQHLQMNDNCPVVTYMVGKQGKHIHEHALYIWHINVVLSTNVTRIQVHQFGC